MPQQKTCMTLAFIDVPNIIDVRESLGEEGAKKFLAKSNKSLESVRKTHGGLLVRSVGSTMLLAFDRVGDAVRACCEIQSLSDVWEDGDPAPVFRIGIHCGEVIRTNGNLVGDAVSTSARLVTNAKPAQILCSCAVADSVPASLRMQLMELEVDAVTLNRFNGGLYEVIWRADREPADPASAVSSRRNQPIQLDIDTVKTHTAPLAVNGEERKKIKLTHMHRKTVDEESGAEVERLTQCARKEDTARLCLVWDRHVVVVDSRKPAVTMGRAAANDIALELETASRQHAHVEWRNGTFYLVDHSWNGTYLYDEGGFETVVHNDEVCLQGGGIICPGCPGNAPEVVAIRFISAG